MKVVRTIHENLPPTLPGVCGAVGFVRADIWPRYDALVTGGNNSNALHNEFNAAHMYANLPVDSAVRAETTKDIVNGVLLYEAAMFVTRLAVATRAQAAARRNRMYASLKTNEWRSVTFTHRQVRKQCRHCKLRVTNRSEHIAHPEIVLQPYLALFEPPVQMRHDFPLRRQIEM